MTWPLVLANRAKIEAKTGWQQTAMHLASMNGHRGVVDLLLKCGADPQTQDGGGADTLGYSRVVANGSRYVNYKD